MRICINKKGFELPCISNYYYNLRSEEGCGACEVFTQGEGRVKPDEVEAGVETIQRMCINPNIASYVKSRHPVDCTNSNYVNLPTKIGCFECDKYIEGKGIVDSSFRHIKK